MIPRPLLNISRQVHKNLFGLSEATLSSGPITHGIKYLRGAGALRIIAVEHSFDQLA